MHNPSPPCPAQFLKKAIDVPAEVTFVFELYSEKEVEIASFHVSKPCIGLGSKALQSLIYQADKHGINLMLIPAGDGLRRKRLVELYERFGFQEDGELMRRTAKPVMQQLAEPEKAYKNSLA